MTGFLVINLGAVTEFMNTPTPIIPIEKKRHKHNFKVLGGGSEDNPNNVWRCNHCDKIKYKNKLYTPLQWDKYINDFDYYTASHGFKKDII